MNPGLIPREESIVETEFLVTFGRAKSLFESRNYEGARTDLAKAEHLMRDLNEDKVKSYETEVKNLRSSLKESKK